MKPRIVRLAILSAAVVAAGCAASGRPAGSEATWAFRPAEYRPAAPTITPAPPVARAAAPPVARAAPPRTGPYAGPYVRLRGSHELHRPGCPKVLRASPEGVVPARSGDLPPCFTCLREEAIARAR